MDTHDIFLDIFDTDDFPLKTIERGLDYFDLGYVRWFEIQQDGRRVVSQVRNPKGKVYGQVIRIEGSADTGLSYSGQCQCPVGYNCKHVVAALAAVGASGQGEDLRGGEKLEQAEFWLQELERAVYDARITSRETSGSTQLLMYILEVKVAPYGKYVTVNPCVARKLKAGGLGMPRRYNLLPSSTARFLTGDDHVIAALLAGSVPAAGPEHRIRGRYGIRLLELLIETGRCYWKSKDGPALRRGGLLEAELAWKADHRGNQRIVLEGVPEEFVPLPVTPPWYLNTADGECGPLDTGLPDHVAELLAGAPELPGKSAAIAAKRIAAFRGDNALPVPTVMEVEERTDVRPVPHLLLTSRTPETLMANPFAHPGSRVIDTMRLWFDYGDIQVSPRDERAVLASVSGNNLRRIRRNREFEGDCFAELAGLGFQPLPGADPTGGLWLCEVNDSVFVMFLVDHVDRLRREGWRIDIEDDFRVKVSESDRWQVDLDDTDTTGWFDLSLGVDVEGERIEILPIISRLMAQKKKREWLFDAPDADHERELLVDLGDRHILRLPAGRLRTIVEVLTELYDPSAVRADGRMKIGRGHGGQVASLSDAADFNVRGGERLLDLGRKLRNFSAVRPVKTPSGFKGTLRGYQREGLSWLQFLREYGLGGILADDMGLGKTIQLLAHVLTEKEAGRLTSPVLVVAPTSMVPTWRKEARRFTPALQVLTLHGRDRKDLFAQIDRYDLAITTYPLLHRDADELLKTRYHTLVLDEAQIIKNPNTKSARTVRRIDAGHVVCLTGTPLENHLGELWAIMDVTVPSLLGNRSRFTKIFRTPIEKRGDERRQVQLSGRIAPFVLRRTKEKVAFDLPKKTEIVQSVELTQGQRDLYETIRVAMHERVRAAIADRGLDQSRITVLDALLKLRQVCCDPKLVKLAAAGRARGSAKRDVLKDMLPEMVEEGRRILIFSQFTTMLGILEQDLAGLNIPFVKLTGQTRDRETPVERFQSGEIPVFLISLKAGGFGLTLTAADTVIHYDPWWNPAVERQATDRAHRIGQDKPVFVYKLIAQGSVEEKIGELQARKQAVADALFAEGAGPGTALRAEDIEKLFQPLD